MCLTHMELREEMYCQLMKQTAKRVHVLSESASALEVMLVQYYLALLDMMQHCRSRVNIMLGNVQRCWVGFDYV